MKSTKEGVYIAGDISGVEEANTALEEGRLAGIDAAEKLGLVSKSAAALDKAKVWERLDGLRLGPHGEARHNAKMRQIDDYISKGGK